VTDLGKILIGLGIQTITEKRRNMATAKLIRWQANIVNHQKADIGNLGTLIRIRRWHLSGAI
jgi:hypothetical protein